MAIGRRGVNINLASNVTGYKIDAFGKQQYDRQQKDQATVLSDVPDFPEDLITPLDDKGIKSVSNLLDADEEKLLAIEVINDENLELCYLIVQNFIERVEEESEDEDIELKKILEEINAVSISETEVVEETSTEDAVEEETENGERVEVNDSDANKDIKDQAEVIKENEEVEEAV